MDFSFRSRWFVYSVLLICVFSAYAEDIDVADLRQAFRDPPYTFRPLPITHGRLLNNPNTLNWLADRRAGGTVLDAGVNRRGGGPEQFVNPAYLNDPEVFDRFRSIMNELTKRGQEVWIYDELAYPSASAAGRVLQGHPEYQVWALSCRDFSIDNNVIQIEVVHQKVQACVAVPREKGVLLLDQAVDLTDKAREGSFNWTPPQKNWIVCLFELYHPDTWKRHNIHRQNVNIMDRDAIRRFIELTHERYARELGTQLEDVTLFFTDEPQFGATEPWMYGKKDAPPAVQWCAELPEAFMTKKGYSLSSVLPALFHNAGNKTSRYRYDFYDIQSDLVAENYYGQIQDWCHQHGLWSSGHMLLEESLVFHVMWSGSMVKNWSRMDLPGVDLLGLPRYKTMGGWNGNLVDVHEDFSCKMASSMARLNNKPGVFTESFATAQNAKVSQVKGIAAWQYASGITHMSTYSISNQLSAADYASFSDFAGRLAILCRRGQPMSEVAVLVPEGAVWAAYNPPDGGLFGRYLERNKEAVQIDHIFRETCYQLGEHQWEFEIFSEKLLQKAEIENGSIKLAGMKFRTLILPEMRMMDKATLQKAAAFVEAGGNVVFVGSLPSQSTQYGDDPTLMRGAKELLETASDRVYHVQDLGKLDQILTQLQVELPPAVRWQGASAVRLLRRYECDTRREIVLIANPGGVDVRGDLIAAFSANASLWDPETGSVTPLGTFESGQSVTVDIPADSARFVVYTF